MKHMLYMAFRYRPILNGCDKPGLGCGKPVAEAVKDKPEAAAVARASVADGRGGQGFSQGESQGGRGSQGEGQGGIGSQGESQGGIGGRGSQGESQGGERLSQWLVMNCSSVDHQEFRCRKPTRLDNLKRTKLFESIEPIKGFDHMLVYTNDEKTLRGIFPDCTMYFDQDHFHIMGDHCRSRFKIVCEILKTKPLCYNDPLKFKQPLWEEQDRLLREVTEHKRVYQTLALDLQEICLEKDIEIAKLQHELLRMKRQRFY